MPPPRRRPATPPTRRPKVAGLHRRVDQAEDTHPGDTRVDDVTAAPSFDDPWVEVPRVQDPVTAAPEPATPAATEITQAPADFHAPADTQAPAATEVTQTSADAQSAAGIQDTAGTVDTADIAGIQDTADMAATAKPDSPPRPALLLPAILVVAALLLGVLAFWFARNLSDARTGVGNDALSDVNATKDVVGAANTAVTAVLSYKFDDMPGAAKRAKEHLAGEAVDQYDKSMAALAGDIEKQQLQVVVTPVSVGVVRLSGADARVLVYADQIGTRADKQPSGGPTQFAMDMRAVDGRWKVVKLDFFEIPR